MSNSRSIIIHNGHPTECDDWAASEIIRLRAKNEKLEEVASWAQAMLTSLNVGNVASGSPLHLKFREAMINYGASLEAVNHCNSCDPSFSCWTSAEKCRKVIKS